MTVSSFADLAFYADDLVIWVNHSDKQRTIELLQDEVYKITKWAHSKRLSFEIKKTKVILFHPDKKVRDIWSKQQLHLNEGKHSPLPYNEHAKLLGVTFSTNCTYQQHFRKVLKRQSLQSI